MNILFLTSTAPDKAGFWTGEKTPPLGLGILMAILKEDMHRVTFSDEYLRPTDILDSDFIEKEEIDLQESPRFRLSASGYAHRLPDGVSPVRILP